MANYYLFPASSYSTTFAGAGTPYSLGVEFEITDAGWVRAIGIYRGSTSVKGPLTGRIYRVSDQSPVAGTDVTFTVDGTGWLTAYLAKPIALQVGVRYRAVVHHPDGFNRIASYWTTGDGSAGIAMGRLRAPRKADATGQGQGTYTQASSVSYPATSNSDGPNYMIDVIVTDVDPDAAQPGPTTPLYGVDVSRYQDGLKLTDAAAAGAEFCVAKVGQGAGSDPAHNVGPYGQTTDTTFAAWRAQAVAAGMAFGGYWYLGNNETPANQAARCLAALRDAGDVRVPLMLDWERAGGDYANLAATVDAFRQAGLDVRWLYTSASYYAEQGSSGDLAALGLTLWNARYPSNNTGTLQALYQPVASNRATYWQTYGGLTTRILQYAQTAQITSGGKAYTVDADAFHGDRAALAAAFAPATTGGPASDGDPTTIPYIPPALDESAQPDWSFVIGPAAGGMTRELVDATARKITFKLTAPSEASVTLDGDDLAAAEIVELATDLHVLRAPRRGAPRVRLFRGRIGKSSDNVDENGHTCEFPAVDYRELLKRRKLMSGSTISWTGQDQAVIAMALVTQTQNKPGGDLGIVARLGATTGVPRDRAYNLGDSIGSKIQELSEVLDGFDWDITSVDPYALVLDIWYPQRGIVRVDPLEYRGAVTSFTRDVDPGEYANAVRLNGTAPDGGGAEPAIQERIATDIATRPEGRWDATYGEQITTTPALSERADWRIADAQVVRPSYTLKLRRGFWQGPEHIWLGDSVPAVLMTGRLRVNTSLRVHEIDIEPHKDGGEDVSLTIGAPRPNYRRRAIDIERRLAELERR